MSKSYEERKAEATRIKEKYTERLPVIVSKHEDCTLPNIDKSKFLVPKDMTLSQFMFVIRKRIDLSSHEALFVTINGKLMNGGKQMETIYENETNDDGFLYVIYTSENTFG